MAKVSLGFLTDLVSMGKDIKSLVSGGDDPGFVSKALKSFTTKKDSAGVTVGKGRGVLEDWPEAKNYGVTVGYQGIQTGNALRGLDYFSKIDNARILLARDNWNAVFNAIQSSNRLPRLGDETDIDEPTTAAAPTIGLGPTKI
tara:strand:- start:1294 stop:1722 length:429 start_codon:yes stop_codon:yes gene_type:complete